MSKHDEQFERELHDALRRVDAPERLMVSLMNLAEAEQPRAAHGHSSLTRRAAWKFPVPRLWMGGALAAALAVGVFAAENIHERRERERAEATQQFEQAQQITDRALAHAREQIERAGIPLGEE